MAGIDDKDLLQPAQVVVDGFRGDGAMLAAQKLGDGAGRESLAHVLHQVLHHPVKQVRLIDPIAFENIPGKDRVVDAVDDLVGALGVIAA